MSTPPASTAPTAKPDQVKVILGEARCKHLRGISNGRFDDHLQTACAQYADPGLACIALIQMCGGKVKAEEVGQLAQAAAPIVASTPVPEEKPEKKTRAKA